MRLRNRQLRPNLIFLSTILLFFVSGLSLGQTVSSGAGPTIRGFASRYNANIYGGLTLVGNTLLVCQTTCTTNNNDSNMVMVNQDSGSGLTNSSSADLVASATIPSGAKLEWAGLYWGGRANPTASPDNRGKMSIKIPGATTYTQVTADGVDWATNDGAAASRPYGSYKNVTALLGGVGSAVKFGTYWGGGVTTAVGNDNGRLGFFSGWSLVVVFKDTTLPFRRVASWDGYYRVSSGNANSASTSVTGFLTPATGAYDAFLGMVAWDGDGATTANDAFGVSSNINATATSISDGQNPANNFFNSTNSKLGALDTSLSPNNAANQRGMDIDLVKIAGQTVLGNSATTANLRFSSPSETYFPQFLGFVSDLYVPDLSASLTKTALDVNGGQLEPGDIIEYTISTTNTGKDTATKSVITDVIPTNTTYVPGSLQITVGANLGTKTDATADDQAEYVSGTKTVTFRIGTGANGTTGGNIGPNVANTVKFRVTVDLGTFGVPISNTALVSYDSLTPGVLPSGGTSGSSSPTVSTVANAVTGASKQLGTVTQISPTSFDVSYSILVTNLSTRTGTNVQLTDNLATTFASPASVVSVSGLAVSGGLSAVNAAFNGGSDINLLPGNQSLAAGASATITFTVRVNTGGNNGPFNNSATVSTANTAGGAVVYSDVSDNGTNPDPNSNGNPSDAGENDPTPFTFVPIPQANLSISKTDGVPTVNSGSTTTYIIRVTNGGPSSVTGALLTDPAATGLTKTSVACSSTPGQCVTAPTIAQLEAGFALPILTNGQFYEIVVVVNVL